MAKTGRNLELQGELTLSSIGINVTALLVIGIKSKFSPTLTNALFVIAINIKCHTKWVREGNNSTINYHFFPITKPYCSILRSYFKSPLFVMKSQAASVPVKRCSLLELKGSPLAINDKIYM